MNRLPAAAHGLRRDIAAALADLPADALVLVACSGGPDSLALALVASALDRPVGAVVVDHGLQPQSADVAARAARQCARLGLGPVLVRRVVTGTGGGPEAAARTARYAALQAAADDTAAGAVLLAHTLDDQAETVLLGLARGSGTRSLAGMPAVRGIFRRPLLHRRRGELAAVLAEHGLPAWDDPHNDDPRYLRSRVRHELLPAIVDVLGHGAVAALARTATLARADADTLDDLAAANLAELRAAGWPVADVAALPAAVRGRVLRQAVLAAGAPATDLTYQHVAAVERLLAPDSGAGPLHLPGGVTVRRRYGRLILGATGSKRESHANGAGARPG